MSQQISILEALLARVKRNAALPRSAPLASGHAAPAPLASTPLAAPAPPPAYVAPQPAYVAPAPPPAYVAPPPAYVAPPPYLEPELPPFQPEFESYVPPAPPAASLDASVDDLLLEDPFPSVPPQPAAPSYNDVLEEEQPIPLVSVSPQRSHDEDISGVMSVSELNEAQPEELLDDDIVEMTVGESLAPSSLDDLNFDDEELDGDQASHVEEPPASSSRSKVASTMDEALARAAEQVTLDEGREVPLKTPPPESGPQAAVALPAGIHAPLAPDIEELLEADIEPKAGARVAVPTLEQLGQTIDLDEARGPSLELDHPPLARPPSLQDDLPPEELEVTLPGGAGYGGGYTADLLPPPEARQELEAHRQRQGEESVPPPPESLAQYPSQRPAASTEFAPVIVPSSLSTDSTSQDVSMVTVDAPPSAEFAPELLARPAAHPTPVAKFIRAQAPRPKTFLELLDASLSLGAD